MHAQAAKKARVAGPGAAAATPAAGYPNAYYGAYAGYGGYQGYGAYGAGAGAGAGAGYGR